MSDWERFPNAPIVEALLDIRAKLPDDVTLEKLAEFQEPIKEKYPERRERHPWQTGIQFKPGASPSMIDQSGGPDGYLFVTADGRQIVQVRKDGFTFSWLKPYDRWDSLRDEARVHWESFLRSFGPEDVSRIAIRYINRIEIPLPMKDFKEYILTVPEIAPGIPDKLRGFFLRLVIPHDDLDCVAIVTETIEPPRENALPLIFDVDIYREQAFDPDDEEMWTAFGHLQEFKNEVFFKSITEKTKELFR